MNISFKYSDFPAHRNGYIIATVQNGVPCISGMYEEVKLSAFEERTRRRESRMLSIVFESFIVGYRC